MTGRTAAWVVPTLCALLLVLAAALTPVLVDEAAFLWYAQEFADHPADPYGFEVFWLAEPQPAFEVTVPPVVPYWLGMWTRIAGTEVGAVLASLPVALLLCFSARFLLRRFAPTLANPLLVIAVLSPAVWPSFNLMLDAPVLALSLAAIAAFLAACDRDDLRWALAAGALSGLAMETKYTGVVSLAVIGLQTLLGRRWRLGVPAAVLAAAMFVGWELFVASLYGESHFLYSARSGFAGAPTGEALLWNLGLLSLLGGLLPAVGLLAAAALSVPGRWSIAAGILVAAAFGLIPALPALEVSAPAAILAEPSRSRAAYGLFLSLGGGVALVWGALLWRAAREARGRPADRPIERLLLGWLVIEVAAFYVISPFLAARRVIGLSVVATFLAGRLLEVSEDRRAWRKATAVAALSAGIGALYVGGMIADARARESLAHALPGLVRDLDCRELLFAAHWSFQHHARTLGYTPISSASEPVPGDCIAVVEGFPRQAVRLRTAAMTRLRVVGVRSAWPWSPVPSYFAGPIPLRPQPRWQARLTLYRVDTPGVIAPRRAQSSPDTS